MTDAILLRNHRMHCLDAPLLDLSWKSGRMPVRFHGTVDPVTPFGDQTFDGLDTTGNSDHRAIGLRRAC